MDPNFIPYIFLSYPHRVDDISKTTAGQKLNRVIVLFDNGLRNSDFEDINRLLTKLQILREKRTKPISDIAWKDYRKAVEDYSQFLGYRHDFKAGKTSYEIDIRRANRVLMALYDPHECLRRWNELETILTHRQTLLTKRLQYSHFNMEQEYQVWLMLKLFMFFPINKVLYKLYWGRATKNHIARMPSGYTLNLYIQASDKSVQKQLVTLTLPTELTPFIEAYVATLSRNSSFWPTRPSVLSLIRGYLHVLGLQSDNTILSDLRLWHLVHKTANTLDTNKIENIGVKTVMDFVNNPGYLHLVDNISALRHFGPILPINRFI